MPNFALVGKKLIHSFSKNYFDRKFEKENINATYINIEVENLENLSKEISKNNILGFNITIPFKETILNFLDDISSEAKIIKAVNCVQLKNGKWIGHNTDVIGFEKSLKNFIRKNKINGALIFGNGGASKAVQYVLKKNNFPFQLIVRNIDIENCISYQELEKKHFEKNNLLINTTPVGTFPNINDILPLPYNFINKTHFCFDLIYNPEKTAFLRLAQDQGAHIKNGEEMLEIQAEESWKIWNEI